MAGGPNSRNPLVKSPQQWFLWCIGGGFGGHRAALWVVVFPTLDQ